jgi:ascorbate-specific PTS system EIIC-type component UlaA
MFNFITKLLKSDRHNIIIVVVDRLTKYSYIILTIEIINTNTIVFLLFRYIFANYRTLQKIISDRDKLFISKI